MPRGGGTGTGGRPESLAPAEPSLSCAIHGCSIGMSPRIPRIAAIAGAAGLFSLSAVAAEAAPVCTFLTPIGGNGQPVVLKSVGAPKVTPLGMAIGRTNWNTDFLVDRPYTSYRFFFTAVSSDPNARYPVQAWMKFSDGSSLQVVNELMAPPMGTGRMFGPFPAVPGKLASQMNVKVGASKDPGSTGFSYRISVQGCN
jgi:hypothetical protein